MAPHHRRQVRRAEREGVSVSEETDTDILISLLRKTYRDHPRKMPEPDFVHRAATSLGKRARLFVAWHAGTPTACLLLYEWGPVAYYAFGGNDRESRGAAQLLQWAMIQRACDAGRARYYLGLVGAAGDEKNRRFSVGISGFKRRFGTVEVPSHSALFVRRPLAFRIWRTLVSLRQLALPRR
jgi:lipid II:glycine glycyltransferase (peptidoglycan interpeptide bridge formation enzyme)